MLRWLLAAAQRNWTKRLHEIDAREKSASSLYVVSNALIAVRQSINRSSGANEFEEMIVRATRGRLPLDYEKPWVNRRYILDPEPPWLMSGPQVSSREEL